MPEGARAAAQQQRARRWWTTSDADDPITLEPIASLDVAPFDLHGALFDARELARYMLTSGVLENPLTRAPLTRAEALALDAHRLRWRLLDDDPTGVATLLDALRLFADSTAQQQRVAATTLAALFNLERRAERSRHAPGAAPGAIDDDAAGASDDEESYPALPSHAAVHPPRPPLLDGHARLFAGAEEARETARIFAESEALRLRAARTRERAERRRVEVAELRREAEAARVEVEAAAVKASPLHT
ncbi:hypothetical protein M885DRAFT_159996 [Pelagophyceae sp. CCMP2097]|nr:hypothetical protein M885DRAFT_159996 [Pelagophyceae sp. CCMP2097]